MQIQANKTIFYIVVAPEPKIDIPMQRFQFAHFQYVEL
jgi:hypothetical protein